MIQREPRPTGEHVDVRGAQVGSRVIDGIGNMLAFSMLQHRLARRIVNVHDSRLALLFTRLAHLIEELRLREHVVLHRLVIVEMILREVREHGRIELDARDALLVQRMTGDFHDHVVHTLFAHHSQRLLQLDHIRRRVVDGVDLILDHDLNCADETHFIARMAQNTARDVARRRLAVRARDADDAHGLTWIIVEIRHDRIERRL